MTETPKDAARRLSAHIIAKGYKPAALHIYADTKGEPLYWRIRAKHPDTGEKWIRPMKLNGSGYELGEPKFSDGKPLYSLHRIATNPGAVVWIVEGEQKADALNKFGLVATTSGGATSADATDWEPLRGRRVTIWPDNDEPGKGYAGEVASILLGLGCSVSCIDVDSLGLGEGEDVMQWQAAHPSATASDIEALPVLATNAKRQSGVESDSVELIRGSDIKPEPVAWLWDGWLAAGKMHVLAGAPGTGKTTISMALAATLSTGGCWPDRSRAPAGNVVIWSGEDDPADTLIPRLAASGADVGRVYFIADVRQGNERRSFDPARDMEALRHELQRIGDVRLLIVDPIVSAVAGDSHKNAEVRRGLQPLADLAATMGCALLGITHFSKGTGGRDPVERLTGSLAFGALARVVMVAAKHQEEGENGRDVRLFLRAKSNIGPDDGGFEYDLNQEELKSHPSIIASSVLWGPAVEGKARELLATAESVDVPGDQTEQGEASDWLRGLLTGGPQPSKEIKQRASQDGLAWATVRRAKKALGVQAVKNGFDGGWEWSLPPKVLKSAQDAQQKEVSTFREFERLREAGEERAAIMEFDGGMSRDDAERLAKGRG